MLEEVLAHDNGMIMNTVVLDQFPQLLMPFVSLEDVL